VQTVAQKGLSEFMVRAEETAEVLELSLRPLEKKKEKCVS